MTLRDAALILLAAGCMMLSWYWQGYYDMTEAGMCHRGVESLCE